MAKKPTSPANHKVATANRQAAVSKLAAHACKSVYTHPPRKHVLLLSCMDQRLMDDIVRFMNKLNLQNRYDHLTFAGGAMGARWGESEALLSPNGDDNGKDQKDQGHVEVTLPWKNVFFHHLEAAIEKLKREIEDIFLLEHLDCGAYKELHPEKSVQDEYKQYSDSGDLQGLVLHHALELRGFTTEVIEYCNDKAQLWEQSHGPDDNPWVGIRVHCLLMDLLGNVTEL